MGEWENYCGEIGEVCKDLQKQAVRIEALEAENNYLREMLNKIRVKASLYAEACECGPDAARLRLIEKESEKGLKKVGYVRSKFD